MIFFLNSNYPSLPPGHFYPLDSYAPPYPNEPHTLHNQSAYNGMYTCNLPPTPGISPPSSQSFQSHASQQPLADSNQSPASGNSAGAANSSGSQVKGRPKKRKASSSNNNNNNNSETGQSNKKLVKSNSKQAASTSNGNITEALFSLKDNIFLKCFYFKKLK